MDWATIHSYAEEGALWSTLIINIWLIVSGVSFIVMWVRHSPASIPAQIARSLIAGVIGGTAILPLVALWSLVPGAKGFPPLVSIIILGVWIPIFIAAIRINMWLVTYQIKSDKISN